MTASFEEFWAIAQEVWRTGVFGVDISSIILALGIFALFLLLRGLFTRFIIGALRLKTKRTESPVDDDLLDALEEPIRLIPVILGIFFAMQVLDLEGPNAEFARNILRSLITAAIFWALFRAVHPASRLLGRIERIFNDVTINWVVRALKAAIAFIGLAAVLEVWGIQVGPIIAGLGLFGVAVALGAQDLFKNLISGILIIAEKRFNKGDWIRVDGVVEGTVEDIGFRSTLVRRFDKAPVFVPNAKLSDNAVTNFTKMTHRRIYWHIGVEYRTTLEQLKTIRDGIEDYILSSDAFAKPPEVATFVRIDRFSDSSIDLMVYCFTRTTVWGEWLEIKEGLAYAIKDMVESAGTGFAFPSQSVYIETIPGESPDLFVPPKSKAKKASK